MTNLSIVTKSRSEQVYDRLLGLITGPSAVVEDRLQPVRTLSERFGTSAATVQRAMARLEQEGRLLRRQGSGTFIASPEPRVDLKRSVALCIEVGADVFGELANALLEHLHREHRPVSLVDTCHSETPGVLARLVPAETSCFVIHGTQHALARFSDSSLHNKPVVGLLDWETDHDFGPVSKVLCDYDAGATAVADHLWGLGHRRLLIVGTGSQIWGIDHPEHTLSTLPNAAVTAWIKRGGTYTTLKSFDGAPGTTALNTADCLALFDGASPPTAIFGLRDTEANLAQRILRQHRPRLAEHTAVVGYYDTPWAVSACPAITAVNVNVAEVARLAAKRIADIEAGAPIPSRPSYVKPRLIVRESSLRAQHQGGTRR